MVRSIHAFLCAAFSLSLFACSRQPEPSPKNNLLQINGQQPVAPITATPEIKTMVHGGCQGSICTNTYLILTEGNRRCYVPWGIAEAEKFAKVNIQTNQTYVFHLLCGMACAGPNPHTIIKIEHAGKTLYEKDAPNHATEMQKTGE